FMMRPSGISAWTLGTPSHEAGKVAISTPGGGLGIIMYPGMDPLWTKQNVPRFDIDTWPASLNTDPPIKKYDTATSHIGFTINTGVDPIVVPNNNTGIGITYDNSRTILGANDVVTKVPESNYVGINTL